MNSNADVNGIPAHYAHTHFYDYIESFHTPETPTIEDRHGSTMKKLRNQLLHDNNWEQKLCLRNCFKFDQKQYVEFCLDKKCGGVDFLKAATTLGYKK